MSIGSNIKKYRKLKGLTQEELANKIMMSKVAIQKYETGKREPRNLTISDIAKALDISVVDLYREEKELTVEDVVQAKEIETLDENTDLIKIIKKYKEETGITYVKLAENIGIAKSTLEDIVYGIRPGKNSTRQVIYDYIMKNNYENKILNLYRKRINVNRILAIHKTMHRLLGLIYIVELTNKNDDIIYEVLLEREIS